MPSAVRISSGLDVLCHSLESWTAVPYNERTPRPTNPLNRPAYQGANPISDIFSLKALRMTVKFLPRVAKDPEDREAQYGMSLASSLAGFGFGNAGVHLCHGLSYPISSQNPGYRHHQYETPHALIPHGVSVAITSPAVFKFTAASNPERHFAAAKIFGEDVEGKPEESAGDILGEALRKFLFELGDQPRGLKALGYSRLDIPNLVTGALPQRRVLNLAPNLSEGGSESEREELEKILEDSFEY